jgi:hypothetical protein
MGNKKRTAEMSFLKKLLALKDRLPGSDDYIIGKRMNSVNA